MHHVSLPCNTLLRTQLLYNLPPTINDISLLVSIGTNCLNLFHPIQILVSTAASASPSTLNMCVRSDLLTDVICNILPYLSRKSLIHVSLIAQWYIMTMDPEHHMYAVFVSAYLFVGLPDC